MVLRRDHVPLLKLKGGAQQKKEARKSKKGANPLGSK